MTIKIKLKHILKPFFTDQEILEALSDYISSEPNLQAFVNDDAQFDMTISTLLASLQLIKDRYSSDLLYADFIRKFFLYQAGFTGKITFSSIQDLKEGDLIDYDQLTDDDELMGIKALNKLAVIKLNGGLGTSMGCEGPKSLIPIQGKKSFLDVIMTQLDVLRDRYEIEIPFYLMNSSHTHDLTLSTLTKGNVNCFSQHDIPRLLKSDTTPLKLTENKENEFCPPGHGDVFLSLYESGYLDRLLNQGMTHVFISNSDNVGAQLDPKIFGYMITHNIDFLMETTKKMSADKKGGTLIRSDNKLRLLELAQVPDEDVSEFEDTHRFRVFNTNNIWIDLRALKQNIDKLATRLSLIINEKIVDGKPIIQFESAMGAAIELFENTASIVVSRNRFIPVKKTSDLLCVQSNLIKKDASGVYTYTNPNEIPNISLSEHFQTVRDYNERIKEIPRFDHLKSLTLNGDIILDENLVFSGEVSVHVEPGEQVILKNETFTNTRLRVSSCERYYQDIG